MQNQQENCLLGALNIAVGEHILCTDFFQSSNDSSQHLQVTALRSWSHIYLYTVNHTTNTNTLVYIHTVLCVDLTLQAISMTIFTVNLLTCAKHSAISTNHLTDTNKTNNNINE